MKGLRILSLLVSAALSMAPALAGPAGGPFGHVTPAAETGGRYWEGRLALGTDRFLSVYANRPMRPDAAVTTAIIVVHGAYRDATNALLAAETAAFAIGRLKDSVVLAPAFRAAGAVGAGGVCNDELAAGEVNWGCLGWRYGDFVGNGGLSTYGAMDALLLWLDRRATYPNLRKIVVLGHSAGGQFVVRYALVNTVHDKLSVQVEYVAANASSYAYLDTQRPRTPNDIIEADGGKAFRLKDVTAAQGCGGFNDWPYGLSNRSGYGSSVTDAAIRENAAKRRLVLLAGEQDDHPNSFMDETCPAYYQGANRLQRAMNYAAYLRAAFQASPVIVTVPGCGHNETCMFATAAAAREIFGKE